MSRVATPTPKNTSSAVPSSSVKNLRIIVIEWPPIAYDDPRKTQRAPGWPSVHPPRRVKSADDRATCYTAGESSMSCPRRGERAKRSRTVEVFEALISAWRRSSAGASRRRHGRPAPAASSQGQRSGGDHVGLGQGHAHCWRPRTSASSPGSSVHIPCMPAPGHSHGSVVSGGRDVGVQPE